MRSGAYIGILEEKLAVLNRICMNVDIDRSSIEECIRAIALNSEEFKALIGIESRLEETIMEETQEVRGVLEEAQTALRFAHEGTAALLEAIRREKETAVKNMGEFARIDAIRNSYVTIDHRPVFVDRDFK